MGVGEGSDPERELTAGRLAARSIERAVWLARAGEVDAVVTAPVHKAALHRAGYRYPGVTEFLGALAGGTETVMMLVTGVLRVALVTTHLPLREALGRITTERVVHVGSVVRAALVERFGIAEPRLALCALNPHAGEGGLFGDEERSIIGPAISDAQRSGVAAEGPFGADTLFLRKDYDAFVVMVHDQGHIMAKTHAEAGAAALTIGTPVLFSSVAHGSALDIAGKNRADPGAMIAAIRRVAGAATV